LQTSGEESYLKYYIGPIQLNREHGTGNTPSTIKTPDQRLRVFISSTLKELKGERNAAYEAVSRLHLTPILFELGARPHLARDLYKAYVEQSHIFIGIYGDQYGWIAPGMEISGLEEEYNSAGRKPKLIYIKSDPAQRDPRLQKMLHAIRDRDGISYKYFSTPDELRELIASDLSLLLSERFDSFNTSHSTTATHRRHNLPANRIRIIGRVNELRELSALILDDGERLVTLTGTGGSGKTRLSLELAHSLIEKFDEVYFIDLSTLTDPKLISSTVAKSIGLREAGSRTPEEQLLDYVTGKNILFILDNFEQIREGSPIVIRLLESSPTVSIVVTSRIALRIRGEREFPVLPLELPASSAAEPDADLSTFSSVALFLRCARAVQPALSLSPDTMNAIAEICTRLDGIPLAIELAAARVKVFPPIVMKNKLNNRLSILSGGARDLPGRQQTMRGAIGWSYDLLDEKAKALFGRLSIFSGGCTVDAIEKICNFDNGIGSDPHDALESLVEMNLVRVRERSDGGIRLDMFETIKEFAAERLEETEDRRTLEHKHGEYYVTFVRNIEPRFRSGEREIYLSQVEEDLDNIRTIVTRSLDETIDRRIGIELIGYLGWFFHLRGYLSEGRDAATAILRLPDAQERTELRAGALFPAGGLAWSQSDFENARKYLDESVAIFKSAGNKYWQIQSQVLLAGSYASLREYDRAYTLLNECVHIAREIGDRWGEAYSLYWLGDVLYLRSCNAAAARTIYEESLEIYTVLNDPWGIAEVKGHLGIIATYQGDLGIARSALEESLHTVQNIGDRWALARGLTGLGDVFLHFGDPATAVSYYRHSLEIWKELGNTPGIKMSLTGLARIHAKRGEYKEAARLLGAIGQPYLVIGILILPVDPVEHQKFIREIRSNLSESEWNSEFEKGETMPLEDILK
jgi:predicted ATPase